MYLLKSIGDIVFGSQSNSTPSKNAAGLNVNVKLSSGQLWYINPSHPKHTQRMIYNDAEMFIRPTGVANHFQVVVGRVFEEGEDELQQGDLEDDGDDEKSFLLDAVLLFHLNSSSQGSGKEPHFLWVDPSDETRTCLYKYVPDPSLNLNSLSLQLFEESVLSCLYERAYHQNIQMADGEELERFVNEYKTLVEMHMESLDEFQGKKKTSNLNVNAKVPTFQTPIKNLVKSFRTPGSKLSSPMPMSLGPTAPSTPTPKTPSALSNTKVIGGLIGKSHTDTNVSADAVQGEVMISCPGQLYLYDIRVNQFVLQKERVDVQILHGHGFEFTLVVVDPNPAPGKQSQVLAQPIEPRMTPYFEKTRGSFVWVYLDDEGAPLYSWSVKFLGERDEPHGYDSFKDLFARVMYEGQNQVSFKDVKKGDVDFLVGAYDGEDVEMRDADLESDDERVDQESDDEEKPPEEAIDFQEEEEEDENPFAAPEKNSLLSVGYKHDRSFVARGNRIGVFRHTDDNRLEFATAINNIRTLGADAVSFSPAKMMLHNQDSTLLMMKDREDSTVYKMDLEVGKVVEEWNVGGDAGLAVKELIPTRKYAQLDPEQTVIGLNNKSIFTIDPRLSGMKRVAETTNTYSKNPFFSVGATTGAGHLAVASDKGEIRLYDKHNIRAKTHLPGLGDPIIGLDSTENGRYLLATCKTYLLLIDTQTDGASDGLSGYKKSMGDKKPIPKRLHLKPEHMAALALNSSISFTPAKFNTGSSPDSEKTIVTSTGPYIITWNFRRVKNGHLNDYRIQKYEQDVVAENFKFDGGDNIVVTLPRHVAVTSKSQLLTPSKFLKSRSEVVNSPY